MSRAVALFKQSCNEIPEIIGSAALALVGLSFGGYRLYQLNRDGKETKYKIVYTIIRSDDPRVARVRTD